MRKFVIGVAAVASAVSFSLMAAPASANNASPCGAVHGAFANVNGNFGWLGHRDPHGANGQATGYNNSHTGCQEAK